MRVMRRLIFVLVFILFLSSSVNVYATVLMGETRFAVISWGVNTGVFEELDLMIGYWEGSIYDIIGPRWTIGNGNVGQTFYVTDTDFDFSIFADRFTNGIDDRFGYFITLPHGRGGGGGGQHYESSLIQKMPGFENEYPDFFGYQLTEIGVTLNALGLESSPEWTSWSEDFTVSFYGVPEPTTLLLLALGGLMLRRKR